ncbi:MAG: acyltransferase family protein [Anaerolineales bacterium]|nr:acyltransferase family protein [Anaerolineales bacterium]
MRLAWIDNAKVLAILAVIIIHMLAWGILDNETAGTGAWWIANFVNSSARWGAAVFVMISGKLLLDPSKKEESVLDFYRKRARRILIPLIFWTIFYLSWQVARGVSLGQPVPLATLFEQLITGLPYYHMWFMYMIVGIYIFTPFIRKLLQVLTQRELLWLCILLLLFSCIHTLANDLYFKNQELASNLFLSYLGYFITGHLLGNRVEKERDRRLLLLALMLAAATAVGVYLLTININAWAGRYFYDLRSFTVVPMSIIVYMLLQSLRKPILPQQLVEEISSQTLGIYLIHPAWINIIGFLGLQVFVLDPLFSILLLSLLVLFLSYLTTKLIQKIPYLQQVI